jgi:hypothetical protein
MTTSSRRKIAAIRLPGEGPEGGNPGLIEEVPLTERLIAPMESLPGDDGAERDTGLLAAMGLLPTDTRQRRDPGLFTQLPAGTPLIVCGDGATESTVKVQVDGRFYLVFRQDIEPERRDRHRRATA